MTPTPSDAVVEKVARAIVAVSAPWDFLSEDGQEVALAEARAAIAAMEEARAEKQSAADRILDAVVKSITLNRGTAGYRFHADGTTTPVNVEDLYAPNPEAAPISRSVLKLSSKEATEFRPKVGEG